VDDGREIALFGYSISSQETWLIHPPNGSKTPGNVIRFSPHQSIERCFATWPKRI